MAKLGALVRRPYESPLFSIVEYADSRWGVLHGAEQFLLELPLPVEDGLLQRAKAALNKQGGWLSSYIDGDLLCIGPREAAHAVQGDTWLGVAGKQSAAS